MNYVITISRQTARWFRTKRMWWFFHSVRCIIQYSFNTYYHIDHSFGILHSLQWWKYYSHLIQMLYSQTSINQSIPIPNLNLLCLINHTILWFTSLLCSIKYNTHHSQYPMLLPVMLLFTFIPILHFISLNQLISPIGPDVN